MERRVQKHNDGQMNAYFVHKLVFPGTEEMKSIRSDSVCPTNTQPPSLLCGRRFQVSDRTQDAMPCAASGHDDLIRRDEERYYQSSVAGKANMSDFEELKAPAGWNYTMAVSE